MSRATQASGRAARSGRKVGRREIDVRPVAGALGAEVHGVDLRTDLDDATVSALRAAWLEHGVLFFRGQDLTPAQYLAVARCFGEPLPYPMLKGLEGFPEITEVLKLEHETVNFGGLWHADTTYLERPAMASVLLARELPPVGGDTLFANQYLAYETLSDGLRGVLDGLVGVNSSEKADTTRTREDRVRDSAGGERKRFIAEHPAVRTHPETGRKALYVNFGHTVRFKGWTEAESAPLLDYLFRHQVRPELTCRFRWEPGSLAIWDNRAVQHNPVNDYHGHRRLMHRITLAGDVPR